MKLIFVLFRVRNSISNAMFILMLVNKKVFSINQGPPTLLSINKDAIIILKGFRLKSSIF